MIDRVLLQMVSKADFVIIELEHNLIKSNSENYKTASDQENVHLFEYPND